VEKASLYSVLQRLDRVIPVVEDMAYRELYFDAPFPAKSLLGLKEWKDYPVIYTGTFTKPFATGMKVGFMVSRNHDCLTSVAKIKGHQDFGTANFTQAIIQEILERGEYAPHLESIRRHYRQKRDQLVSALLENGLDTAGWRWELPLGGLLLWTRGPEGIDTRLGSAFHDLCLEQEILYVPGDLCFAEGRPYNYVRLSFGALESEWIPEATRRFCVAARKTTTV
jgi:2-aminoadipate transaminase